MACLIAAYLASIVHQVLASDFGLSLLRLLWARMFPGQGSMEKTALDGSTENTLRAHPGLA